MREGEWAEVEREHAGRIAGSDAGWGVFDQQPAFHPRQSAQRRTGRERGRDGGREGDAERGGRKGGRCCLNAPLLPAECQHLSLSTSPPALPPSFPLSAFDLPLCAAAQTRRHQMASVLEKTTATPHINTEAAT